MIQKSGNFEKWEIAGFERFKHLRSVIKSAIKQGLVWGTTGKYYPITKGMKLYHRDIQFFVKSKNPGFIAYELYSIPVYMYTKKSFTE